MFYSIEQDLHRLKYRQLRKKNLTKEEYQSIKSLRNHPDIIIKPADKGSAIVILDKDNYVKEGERQLHNDYFYEETDTDLTEEVIHRVNLYVNNMLQRGQISQNTSKYLTTDIDRPQQFYLLSKIHKDIQNPLGRPIVSGSRGAYRENISVCGPLYRTTCTTLKILHKGLNPQDKHSKQLQNTSRHAIMHSGYHQFVYKHTS